MRYGMGPVMRSAGGKPDTAGWIAEVDYMPLPNVKLALRRSVYSRFNGGKTTTTALGATRRTTTAGTCWPG